MGSVGDSYDNALMENFWSTLKIELVYRTVFETREQAEHALFGYIDGFYNPRRIQRRLGYRSPDQYEALHQPITATGASTPHHDGDRVAARISRAGPGLPASPDRRVRRGSRVKGGRRPSRSDRKTLEA
jgi:hypothetical protein